MVNCFVKRRATGKAKAIRGFRTGGQEASGLKESVPLKVWKMLSPDAQDLIRSGREEKIGLVKESRVKANRHGGGKLSKTKKVLRNKFFALVHGGWERNPNR